MFVKDPIKNAHISELDTEFIRPGDTIPVQLYSRNRTTGRETALPQTLGYVEWVAWNKIGVEVSGHDFGVPEVWTIEVDHLVDGAWAEVED